MPESGELQTASGQEEKIPDPYTVEEHHIELEGGMDRPEVFLHFRRASLEYGVDNVSLLRDSDALQLYELLGEYLDGEGYLDD